MTEPSSGDTGGGEPLLRPPSPARALLLCAIVAGAVALLRLTPLRDLAVLDHIDARVDSVRARLAEFGAWGPLAFTGALAVLVAVGVPRLALAALAGAVFGGLEGSALAQAATIVGCLLTFAAGRGLGREFVAARVGGRFPRIGSLLAFVGRHGILSNVVLRVMPVGNCFATNLLMSVSPVSVRDFAVGTFVGTLPETIVFAMFGSAAATSDASRAMTLVAVGTAVLAAAAVGVAYWAHRRMRPQPQS